MPKEQLGQFVGQVAHTDMKKSINNCYFKNKKEKKRRRIKSTIKTSWSINENVKYIGRYIFLFDKYNFNR